MLAKNLPILFFILMLALPANGQNKNRRAYESKSNGKITGIEDCKLCLDDMDLNSADTSFKSVTIIISLPQDFQISSPHLNFDPALNKDLSKQVKFYDSGMRRSTQFDLQALKKKKRRIN